MRIAITSDGKTLSANVDPRFGRAPFFILLDTETMAFEAIENRQNLDLPQGAGIQAGKTVIQQKAEVLITGSCGPKAFKVLQSAGVQICTGARGTVGDVARQYTAGQLQAAQAPDVEGHWV